VLPHTYEGENCSIAKSLELLGERWTLLIVREAFRGRRRFEEFAERLDIARNVLSTRLARFVDEGVLERVAYQQRPLRFEYRLTDKGRDLWPVIVSLLQFGDRHYAPAGPPVLLRHRDCGGLLDDRRRCTRCGAELGPGDVRDEAGPGAVAAA
jgi:DNA-binding HxlR family transcriptional regulator